MNKFMKAAVKEAYKGIQAGHGGPFGTVIVKDGKIIARGHNHVLANNDPTAHGEIYTIRKACKKLNTYDLSGCELYTTGQPCIMCLAACMWANIKHVYYACTIEDNGLIGFRDEIFGDTFKEGYERMSPLMSEMNRDEGLKLFADYNKMTHTIY